MTRKLLGTAGAVVMILGAAMHSYGWTIVGAKFAGPLYDFSRSIWFLLAIDWLVMAAIWLQGARGAASPTTMRIAAIIPVAMVLSAFSLMGPSFIGAWVLLIASALGVAASYARP